MQKYADLPTPGRHRFDKAFATERPASKAGQVRLPTGFIEKHESFRIYAGLAYVFSQSFVCLPPDRAFCVRIVRTVA